MLKGYIAIYAYERTKVASFSLGGGLHLVQQDDPHYCLAVLREAETKVTLHIYVNNICTIMELIY